MIFFSFPDIVNWIDFFKIQKIKTISNSKTWNLQQLEAYINDKNDYDVEKSRSTIVLKSAIKNMCSDAKQWLIEQLLISEEIMVYQK